MGLWDSIKDRLGFGPGWDSEYVNEEIAAADLDVRTDVAGGASGATGAGGAGEAGEVGGEGSGSSGGVSTEPAPGFDRGSIPGGATLSERFYSQESPYASGAAPSAVTKHVRKPDLERAAAAIGAPLRDVPSSLRGETGGTLRAATASRDGSRVEIRSFDDMNAVADRFKEGNAVMFDVSEAEPAVRRRCLDFALGLAYGRDGSLSRTSGSDSLLFKLQIHPRRQDSE
jgi:hypothetical protein